MQLIGIGGLIDHALPDADDRPHNPGEDERDEGEAQREAHPAFKEIAGRLEHQRRNENRREADRHGEADLGNRRNNDGDAGHQRADDPHEHRGQGDREVAALLVGALRELEQASDHVIEGFVEIGRANRAEHLRTDSAGRVRHDVVDRMELRPCRRDRQNDDVTHRPAGVFRHPDRHPLYEAVERNESKSDKPQGLHQTGNGTAKVSEDAFRITFNGAVYFIKGFDNKCRHRPGLFSYLRSANPFRRDRADIPAVVSSSIQAVVFRLKCKVVRADVHL